MSPPQSCAWSVLGTVLWVARMQQWKETCSAEPAIMHAGSGVCHCLGANETPQGPREGRDDWGGGWGRAGWFRLGMAEMANCPWEMFVPCSTGQSQGWHFLFAPRSGHMSALANGRWGTSRLEILRSVASPLSPFVSWKQRIPENHQTAGAWVPELIPKKKAAGQPGTPTLVC